MKKNLTTYLPDSFKKWLDDLSQSKETDLFTLYNLKQSGAISQNWEIKIYERKGLRTSPIRKPQGYLVFPNNSGEEIVKEIANITVQKIRNNEFTIPGLANHLILLDLIGSVLDSLKYDLLEMVCKEIKTPTYIKLIDELISVFNTEYHFSDQPPSSIKNFNDWQDLFFKLQYLEPFDNPISLLRKIIRFRLFDIPILNIIEKISPDPRASIFSYGLELKHTTADDLLVYLKSNPTEAPFYAVYLIDEYDRIPNFADSKLINSFITDYWESTGRYLLSQTYDNKRRTINEPLQALLFQAFHNFFIDDFGNEELKHTVLTSFEWPSDFLALGGWLSKFNEEEDTGKIVFSSIFVEDFVISFTSYLRMINMDIAQSIVDSSKPYDLWFNDVFDIKAQHTSGYLLRSIMHCDETTFENLKHEIKGLLYNVKELYYGAYQANYLAQKISGVYLSIVLSYPNAQEKDQINLERLNELFQLFDLTVGIQWVSYTERNRLIWNTSTDEIGYGDFELLYILKRLKNVPEIYEEEVTIFRKCIDTYSSINWQNTINKI